MAESDLGEDFAGVTDIDFALSFVSGRRCLAEAVARRWYNARGSLFYNPDYGVGLVNYLSAAVDTSTIAAELEAEALKDERVDDCNVQVTRTEEGELRIVGVLRDADGPFDFTVTANGMTVQLMMGEAA